ncbi:hypothetical protein PF005_g7917 [Phytophthora fragariae]|uniref:RxLR effector protein n=2 Tax=Phytophthora TaxID=4783 RepID=A0A6A3U9E1_9STRA|nr:hypothetical protein PF003_g5973 [Phytophthora fragariae]KAE9038927.1 hypothetical protein PR002_g5766 [Phytophthora rubi]KAE8941229.1 hypothetical protein PF009_g8987 [Phytophthora fragariae]KAE9016638.1 hypothetical protein PF011_g7068 [Phytophthora fragariae]KAE9041789.1 hypothetical protein PR001_g6464 [Phytophthora rubi]
MRSEVLACLVFAFVIYLPGRPSPRSSIGRASNFNLRNAPPPCSTIKSPPSSEQLYIEYHCSRSRLLYTIALRCCL